MIKGDTHQQKKCPDCGEITHMIYGWGWDYDVIICGDRDCDWDLELSTTSYPDGEEP